MTRQPRDVHVQVHLHPAQNPSFHLTSSDLPIGPNGELIFSNYHHPGFLIHFDLQDPTHGYLFPEQKHRSRAVWSQFGSGACPESEIWDVFRALSVTNDRKTLVVRNANVHPELGKFGYTLRVVKDEDDWLELDPPGDNQNGGIGNFEWSSALAGAISGFIGAAGAISTITQFDPSTALLYGVCGAVVGLIVGLLLDRF